MKLLLWTYIFLTLEALAIVPLMWLAAVLRDAVLAAWRK